MFWCSDVSIKRFVGFLAIGVGALAFGGSAFAGEAAGVRAIRDPVSGYVDVLDGDLPVLRYNYDTVQPPAGFGDLVKPEDRKYAQPRGDYIHPLYGLDGETLTADWSPGHPHHRGVYWAWPEVDYRGQRGDLHALQHVFARPANRIVVRNENDSAEIEAESIWVWEDGTAIVRETATIRVWHSNEHGRYVDLMLKFEAIDDDVTLARRHTIHYGGLNLRLSPIDQMKYSIHSEAKDALPPPSWGEANGIWSGGRKAGLAVLQHPDNPEYPGQWIKYPDLPWFQPTFPLAETRYTLKPNVPLVLRYRLWIHRGDIPSDESFRRQWESYVQAVQ